MSTTVSPGSNASFYIGAFDAVTLAVTNGVGSFVFDAGPASDLRSAVTAGLQSKVYGPFGAPGLVTINVTSGVVAYDINVGVGGFALDSTGSPVSGAGSVSVSGDVTINSANASTYNGKTLIWSTAATVTLAAGLPTDFGFAGRPPASGNASVASANTGGLPTIDGATTTITRALASNKLFAVQWVAADAYTATGS